MSDYPEKDLRLQAVVTWNCKLRDQVQESNLKYSITQKANLLCAEL
jgi:hypothetical protein